MSQGSIFPENKANLAAWIVIFRGDSVSIIVLTSNIKFSDNLIFIHDLIPDNILKPNTNSLFWEAAY